MASVEALLIQFTDSWSASLACDTLQQLGYDPVLHDGNRIHIHLNSSDTVPALEIVQAHGGRLLELTAIDDSVLTNTAYSLDGIAIPAHLVNEDWTERESAIVNEEAAGLRNRDDDADTSHEFLPDPGNTVISRETSKFNQTTNIPPFAGSSKGGICFVP
ncbi:hypothetical protein [Paenibacillus protaetiae]|uniref:hypothetical protein n=1 Tax=Paenibacillus protaetiae TaxID=2509456 RepID=UPI001FC94B1B|nr:hypothetical protein [Paenibacillus protaetiae]